MDFMETEWYRQMSRQLIWFVLGWKYQDQQKHDNKS